MSHNELELQPLSHVIKRPLVDIQFNDITYSAGNVKSEDDSILHSVSGQFSSGELTAIMGPSGSGKTTLMNILSGYVKNYKGTILANGSEQLPRQISKISAYIMHDSVLRPNLSAEELLGFAASLKIGNLYTKKEKKKIVDEILFMLGLDNCRDTTTDRLSGGEAKRLSVALELVNNPPVIFLDEPTTGLDVVSIKQLISLLKVLARQGRTIICTIHQPTASIYQQFDHVYVLGRGQCVYQGSHNQLVPFLSSVGFNCPITYNPADYVIECVHGEAEENITVLSNKISNGKISMRENSCGGVSDVDRDDESVMYEYKKNSFQQMWIILYMMWLQIVRNRLFLLMMLGHYLTCSLLIAGLFYGIGNNGDRAYTNFLFAGGNVIFFCYTYCVTCALNTPILIKFLEIEYFNRWYTFKAYYIAYELSSIPQHVIMGIFYVTIVYLGTDQSLELSRYMWVLVSCIIAGRISESIAQIFGSLLPAATGLFCSALVHAPAAIFLFVNLGSDSSASDVFQFFSRLSFIKLATVCSYLGMFEHRAPLPCFNELQFCYFADPRRLIRDANMSDFTKIGCLTNLLIILCVCRISLFVMLKIKLNFDLRSRILLKCLKIARMLHLPCDQLYALL